ncbi:helix-turn-helix domain-containing protein [Mucilaginibacter ginkgonis]|uniref:Helix-turn-helix domain-containing protein n=1 Tax=Mucilaginibacter ginkgonis TaxID=2682091 RepID=A0A7T7F9I3_9SPHI|nr:helix-turn-helix domain-containing protein [Mucilaginibacter ginkgonis]QQL48287.1 helix-turn-helix domain-containing protein [Mucilaginibacter ginkgonis]QQL49054.1 helix-turn-helix domain-containing protein [Mucilaginibacter ginkgonis]QQL49076.1 helix-turn-helix domain-containing protein [Mucilaginibacter ginkgonis]QQL49259.1 helix-turn-helix domain-containing protein [Mucilaginibacter ginkgonis]QQL49811.1 helix-turn-helix domain-containing protein [Mucilaginibacter ginkgonis]
MDKWKAERIIHEREIMGKSLRTLAKKYGVSPTTISRIVNKDKLNEKALRSSKKTVLPDDVSLLKAMLRTEQLKNELLNNIIDIADKELGTNIRKKSGTRQSE